MINQVRQLGGVRERRQEAMNVVRGMLSASQGRGLKLFDLKGELVGKPITVRN
jgi:hypothetical protein